MYGNHQSITGVISGFRDKGPKTPEGVLELTLLCVLKGGNSLDTYGRDIIDASL